MRLTIETINGGPYFRAESDVAAEDVVSARAPQRLDVSEGIRISEILSINHLGLTPDQVHQLGIVLEAVTERVEAAERYVRGIE